MEDNIAKFFSQFISDKGINIEDDVPILTSHIINISTKRNNTKDVLDTFEKINKYKCNDES